MNKKDVAITLDYLRDAESLFRQYPHDCTGRQIAFDFLNMAARLLGENLKNQELPEITKPIKIFVDPATGKDEVARDFQCPNCGEEIN